MGVMKRIADELQFNPELTGRRDNPELAAMYAIWQASRQRACLALRGVEQLAARKAHNLEVPGSSPGSPTSACDGGSTPRTVRRHTSDRSRGGTDARAGEPLHTEGLDE